MNLCTLSKLMQAFVEHDEPTIEMANLIEVLLDDYLDDEILENMQEGLARFRPEGGDYLFDTNMIKVKLKKTLEHINSS